MTGLENERLAKVELEVKHMRETQEEMKKQVGAMYEAFMAARGAKWVLITMWIGFGAFLANVKLLLTYIGVKFE